MKETLPLQIALDQVRTLILAGGASSRFFPVNKIFADLTGSGRTMIQQSLDRVLQPLTEDGPWKSFMKADQAYIVTGTDFAATIRQQLAIPAGNVFVEPARRNTWPAILWAMAHIRRQQPDATVVMLTADHVIGEHQLFRQFLAEAIAVAQQKPAIVTFGIQPSDRPQEWTSFGAIRGQDQAPVAGTHAVAIERFEEKPELDRAEQMIEAGRWTWNSGMFIFRISTAEKAMADLQPSMFSDYQRLCEAVASGDEEAAKARFEDLQGKIPHPLQEGAKADNSIDFAIMTPLTTGATSSVEAFVIPATFPWTDIGSWNAIREVVQSDENGNLCIGEVQADAVRDSTLVAETGKQIHAKQLQGVAVIHAANGWVMVAPEDEAAAIKPMVEAIREQGEPPIMEWESEHCQVEGGSGKVALFRQRNLNVVVRDQAVWVHPREA
ncbi:MAG: hypothetical protein DWQ01_21385 [Planctomycetota bacterium]|nr:MAG: hypothetical protein DWQ01_21385 [Planctomycetota bacterium]